MTIWRVNNSTLLGGEVCAEWVPNHAYSLGARVVCRAAYGTVARRGLVYECTDAGTSHAATEPTWPTSGTVADNDIVWTCRSPNDGTWDNASCYLYNILNHTAIEAGDSVYIADSHSENLVYAATHYSINGSGTPGNPIKIYSVDKTDDSLSAGALVSLNASSMSMRFSGYGYSYGVTYKVDTSAGPGIIGPTFGDSSWILESDGGIVLQITAANQIISQGEYGNRHSLTIINGSISFGHSTNEIQMENGAIFVWRGGSLLGTPPVRLFGVCSDMAKAVVEGVDLSNLGNNSLLTPVSLALYDFLFTRCKLPTFFNVIQNPWIIPRQGRVRLHHCSAGNDTYNFVESSFEGTCVDETAVVRTGGASDGTTPISMKMISSAGTNEGGMNALESPPIHGWTESAVEKTFAIQGVWDNAVNLQNDEIWMELQYPANNTDGLGALATSRCSPLAAPADVAASGESWATGGISPGAAIAAYTAPLNTDYSVTSDRNLRQVIPAASISTSGTRCRIKLEANSGALTIFDGVSIGERSGTTGNFAAAPTQVTFNGGNTSVSILAGGTAVSDWIVLDIDESKDYLVHLASVNQNFEMRYGNAGSPPAIYYKDGAGQSDESLTQNISGYSSANFFVQIVQLDVWPAISANEFALSVTVTPGKAGPITTRVFLAKPSTTVYIDPLITES